MTADGDRGTMIPVHQSTKDRVAGLRTKQVRTYDEVLSMLLDEHDTRHPPAAATTPEAKGAHPVRDALVRAGNTIIGRDREEPRDQAAPGVPA